MDSTWSFLHDPFPNWCPYCAVTYIETPSDFPPSALSFNQCPRCIVFGIKYHRAAERFANARRGQLSPIHPRDIPGDWPIPLFSSDSRCARGWLGRLTPPTTKMTPTTDDCKTSTTDKCSTFAPYKFNDEWTRPPPTTEELLVEASLTDSERMRRPVLLPLLRRTRYPPSSSH